MMEVEDTFLDTPTLNSNINQTERKMGDWPLNKGIKKVNVTSKPLKV